MLILPSPLPSPWKGEGVNNGIAFSTDCSLKLELGAVPNSSDKRLPARSIEKLSCGKFKRNDFARGSGLAGHLDIHGEE